MRLRLVTYNIHKGIGGVDRRYHLQRIVDTLSHCQADVVCLQEVDEGVPRSRGEDQAALLADALEMPHFAQQRNVRLKQGHYGNAILSRFPLGVVTNVDLKVPLKKHRRALLAECELPVGGPCRTLLMASLHLGLAGYERQIQLSRLLRHPLLAQHAEGSSIALCGDYNDVWSTLGRRVMQPAGFQAASKTIRTFPAIMPLRPLDQIFYRGLLRLDHAFASRTKIARQASDHLPLVAEFELETPNFTV